MPSKELRAEKEKLLEVSVARLQEHFDSIIIITTFRDEDLTGYCVKASGNYYTNLGVVSNWLDVQREINRQETHKCFDQDDD